MKTWMLETYPSDSCANQMDCNQMHRPIPSAAAALRPMPWPVELS